MWNPTDQTRSKATRQLRRVARMSWKKALGLPSTSTCSRPQRPESESRCTP
ncbi:hypothetical protein CISG_01401 [Coccidioides immitis RMSCC 3703]|uniref:Uncharacterized protein n=1 Tax=Coccidioides immitis RMSCC 3703 TaxID=454286 RepID=A0A0J8QXM6_COCIT|nr:hypothetical protein CISG_01401 [Coccidioides immitis RMSCC 3703]